MQIQHGIPALFDPETMVEGARIVCVSFPSFFASNRAPQLLLKVVVVVPAKIHPVVVP